MLIPDAAEGYDPATDHTITDLTITGEAKAGGTLHVTIPMGKEISQYDIRGSNAGHKDAEPYYPNGFGHALPRGQYKIIMVDRSPVRSLPAVTLPLSKAPAMENVIIHIFRKEMNHETHVQQPQR